MAHIAKIAIGVGVIGFIIIAAFGLMAFQGIDEGYVGVEKDRGAATGVTYQPGWHFINPITQSVEHIETRPLTVDYDGEQSIYVITQDGQDVWVDVTVRYSVTPDGATEFYREYRAHDQARERVIEPTVRSDMRDEASDIAARDIITRDGRLSLEAAVNDALVENFQGTGMTVEAVQVRGVDLNEEFSSQLEQVEIEATEAERKIIEAEAEAEAEIIRAQGDAEAAHIRDEALTDAVLMDKYLDQLDDNTIILATDSDGTPIIISADDVE